MDEIVDKGFNALVQDKDHHVKILVDIGVSTLTEPVPRRFSSHFPSPFSPSLSCRPQASTNATCPAGPCRPLTVQSTSYTVKCSEQDAPWKFQGVLGAKATPTS